MGVKISAMTAAGALDGTELVELVQGGANVKATAQDIADLATNSPGGGAILLASSGSPVAHSGDTDAFYIPLCSIAPGVLQTGDILEVSFLVGMSSTTFTDGSSTQLTLDDGTGPYGAGGYAVFSDTEDKVSFSCVCRLSLEFVGADTYTFKKVSGDGWGGAGFSDARIDSSLVIGNLVDLDVAIQVQLADEANTIKLLSYTVARIPALST